MIIISNGSAISSNNWIIKVNFCNIWLYLYFLAPNIFFFEDNSSINEYLFNFFLKIIAFLAIKLHLKEWSRIFWKNLWVVQKVYKFELFKSHDAMIFI
jgi:hypothetical protein